MRERIVLVADIHANAHALRAVWRHVSRQYAGERYKVWCLGDLFGRGPDPTRALSYLMDNRPEATVAGNHDWGITGQNKNVNVHEHQPEKKPRYTGPYNDADWLNLLRHRHEVGRYRRAFHR